MAGSFSSARKRDPWLSVPRPLEEPRVRLFCFPHAGGSATAYHGWAALLPADVEVASMQLPGRTYRISEPNVRDMTLLIEAAAAAIEPYLDRPYLFLGHSMGALIAFELARRFERSAEHSGLRHLIVSSRRAPQLPTGVPPLHALSDRDFRDELHRIFAMPRELLDDEKLMALAMPALRADFEAMDSWSYVPAEPLAIPITAIGGRSDVALRPGDLEAWGEQTTSTFAAVWLDGGHAILNERRDEVLQILRQAL